MIQQTGGLGELTVHMNSKRKCAGNLLLFREGGLFVLFSPSTDWMRPTYIMEVNLIYSVFSVYACMYVCM